MQRYADSVQFSNGDAAIGTTVTVKTLAGVAATIYAADNASPYADNVLTVDNTGEYYFYAANGRYTLTIKAPGHVQEIRADILLYDPVDAVAVGCDCAGRHAIWITAGSMAPTAADGCSPLAIIVSSSGPDWMTLDFDDAAPSYAQFNIRMPKSWDEGTITFAPVWSFNAEDDTQTVCWSLEAVATGNGELLDTAYGTPEYSIDTAANPGRQYIGPESDALTVANASVEGVVRFRVGRITSDDADTSVWPALLHGLTIYITTDAVNDA